jgi:hypothetical protein
MHAAPSRFDQWQQLHAYIRARASVAVGEEREHLAEMSRFIFQAAREDQDRERLSIVFRRAGGGELWEIGDENATHLVAASSVGVAVAHGALLGERPAADKATTHAVRVTAASWARHAGCPRLAEVFPRIAVRGGHLEFLPGPRPPHLLLL